jgi:hypothetical protein
VVAVDFIERLTGRKAAEFYGTLASRLLPWGVGAMAIVLGVGVGRIEGNILELCNKVVNLLVVPLAGLFFMAMFVRSATPFGAWVGAAGGMAAGVLVSYWKDLTGTSGIAFFWMMPVSLAVQMAVGCLASLLPIGPPARPLLTEQRGKSG